MHTSRRMLTLIIAAAMMLSLVAMVPCAADVSAIDLNPADAEHSEASSINSSGHIAGSVTYEVYDILNDRYVWHTYAVIWDSDGTMTKLDPTGTFGNSEAKVINDAGQVTGTYNDNGLKGAFIWDSANGMIDMGSLYYPDPDTGELVPDNNIDPAAINSSGWVIGASEYYEYPYMYSRSWIYRNGTMEKIETADGKRIAAFAINDSGQVSGVLSDPLSDIYGTEYRPAVIWEKPIGAAAPTVTILTPGDRAESAYINNSGQVAIYRDFDRDIAFWDDGVLTNLEVGGGSGEPDTEEWIPNHYEFVITAGINESGQIFGIGRIAAVTYLWAWKNGTLTEYEGLPFTDYAESGLHINNSGQMAGSYGNWMESKGFVWSASDSTIQILTGLGGTRVGINSINDNGEAAGIAETSDEMDHACKWEASVPPGPSNEAPVLDVSSAPSTGLVRSPITFTATATDPDDGDTLTFSLTGAPEGASIDPSNGDFTWTPSINGTYSFDVTVTDTGGLSDTETVTIVVSSLTISDADITIRKDKATVCVYISNPCEVAAEDVTITAASLGDIATNSTLPISYGIIKAGASKKVMLQFKNVLSGDNTLTIIGSSTLGSFTLTKTVNVP